MTILLQRNKNASAEPGPRRRYGICVEYSGYSAKKARSRRLPCGSLCVTDYLTHSLRVFKARTFTLVVAGFAG